MPANPPLARMVNVRKLDELPATNPLYCVLELAMVTEYTGWEKESGTSKAPYWRLYASPDEGAWRSHIEGIEKRNKDIRYGEPTVYLAGVWTRAEVQTVVTVSVGVTLPGGA